MSGLTDLWAGSVFLGVSELIVVCRTDACSQGNSCKSDTLSTENFTHSSLAYFSAVFMLLCAALFTSCCSWLAVYGGLTGGVIVIALLRASLFFWVTMVAATRMHNNMVLRVLRAPLAFFHTNPAGRVLNRFSNDQVSVCLSLLGVLKIVECEPVGVFAYIKGLPVGVCILR